MLIFTEEKQNLSKRKKRYRYIYSFGIHKIYCSLRPDILMYLYKSFNIKNDCLKFCKFVANKTHYHKIKYNDIDISLKNNKIKAY